jgi:hypothetical protein
MGYLEHAGAQHDSAASTVSGRIPALSLHILSECRYNSVIFTTRSAVDYQAAVVTEGFLHGGAWKAVAEVTIQDGDYSIIERLQATATNLTRLSSEDCLNAYAKSMYETNWRNVLVVTSLPSTNSSLINVYDHLAAGSLSDLVWACDGNAQDVDHPKYGVCSSSALHPTNAGWIISDLSSCPEPFRSTLGYNILDGSDSCQDNIQAPIEYCLAQEFQPHCTVSISTTLLIVVIVCNVIKILCLGITLFARNFEPLVNIGDTVESYLRRPDPTTVKMGALEVGTVSSGIWRDLNGYAPTPWLKQKRRWWYAVPRLQLNFTFLALGLSQPRDPPSLLILHSCFMAWLTAAIALGKSVEPIKSAPFASFGAIDTNNIISNSNAAGLISNVVLVNTPQLVISFIYLFYNDAFTRMFMCLEWAKFASERKALRVSRPRGEQRSTFWLTLPYRCSLPLMLAMVLLHWLVSRSLFLVRISIYDVNGWHDLSRDINACGFSPLALLLALCVSTIMIAVLVGLGRFRYIEAGIPTVSSCSVAISAAVHPLQSEPEDASLLPLQYGVIPSNTVSKTQYTDRETSDAQWSRPPLSGREHVSFSSGPVRPLENGAVYW